MANPKVSFTISPCPGITNKLISVLYSTLAPTAEIARIVDSSTHASPVNQQFSNLNPGTYIVKIYQSTDGTTLGTIQHDFWIDANSNQVFFERIFFTVGGGGANDPIDGDASYINTYLNGKVITGVFQEGFRYLKPTTEYTEYTGGGITLVGRTYSDLQTWSVDISYLVASTTLSPDDTYANIISVPGNLTVGSAHYNAALYCSAAATTQTLTFPFISSVPDNKAFLPVHDGGSQVNVKLVCQTGEFFRFRGANINVLYLAKGEYVKIIKKGTSYYVVEYRGQWDRIGEAVDSDYLIDNALVMNGAEYDGLVYQRAYDFIVNRIPSGQKVDKATWLATPTKQTLFGVDLINSKFIVPNRLNLSKRNIESLSGTDTNRADNVPGGFQDQDLMPHAHPLGIGNGVGGLVLPDYNPADLNTRRATANTDNSTGVENIVKNFAVLPLMLI